jgi:alpha 1,3-glucosidase
LFQGYPEDVRTFKIDDQYMIGDSLLVKPVTDANTNKASVYFPAQDDWFDLETLLKVAVTKGGNGYTTVDAPLTKIPVYLRSGKVLPRKLRLRRSSKLMFFDPYTLVIAPDAAQTAEGLLYMDDEHSQAHETVGAFAVRVFRFANNELRSERPAGVAESAYVPVNTVERVVIAGQSKAPKSVVVVAISSSGEEVSETTAPLSFTFDAALQTVTVKKPDVRVADDWVIRLAF